MNKCKPTHHEKTKWIIILIENTWRGIEIEIKCKSCGMEAFGYLDIREPLDNIFNEVLE